MPEPTEVANHAVHLASQSLEALRRFVDDSAVVNDALGVLVQQEEPSVATRMAIDLLVHLDSNQPSKADRNVAQEGWAALGRGDLQAAASAADSLLEEAAAIPDDDWDHDNLLHDGYIIRGHVQLRLGDLPGAEAALRATGTVRGSPQLDSFGPDLSLAWEMLRLNRDDAVLDYLHGIARLVSRRWSRLTASPGATHALRAAREVAV